MILISLVTVLLAAGLLTLFIGNRNPTAARWITLAALGVVAVLGAVLWASGPSAGTTNGGGRWIASCDASWIPQIGARFHLAVDGLSLLMVLLTAFLGVCSVVTSWTEVNERVGFFHFNLCWILAGVIGVFLAMDLLLFFFFWEMMLIPMYFLIGIWGHERRIHAAIKFFIFTQVSGLLMLVAIMGLYFAHHGATSVYTFSYEALLNTPLTRTTGMWLMLGFFVAFAVKLPAVPFHTWLPDAHTQAPTAGSVILAGLLLKTGAYGLIRFAVPLFPEAAEAFAPWAMTIGAIGILYGALLAFAQDDFKRLVAYTSISHLGFVLVGVYAWNDAALKGVILQMICHGFSTGALFMIAGALQERLHTRDLNRLGGLWPVVPKMSAVGLFFAMASLGLPGLGNFVAEFLVLVGAFQANPVITVVATLGLVGATIYSLVLVARTFFGPTKIESGLLDLRPRDMIVMVAMILALVWLGFYPAPVLDTLAGTLTNLTPPLMR